MKLAVLTTIRMSVLCSAVMVSSCAATFVSTWKAPDAQPLEVNGAKVAAVVMMKSDTSRRRAEDKLAMEISARGAQGVAMYTIYPDAEPSKEAATRAALEKAGFQGVVVMRPLSVDKEISSTPVTYMEPAYRGYWGGYYGYGWGSPWGAGPIVAGGDIRTDTVVTIETLVYSLKQNKLVWSGRSKFTNPPEVDEFIAKLAGAAATELEKAGLMKP